MPLEPAHRCVKRLLGREPQRLGEAVALDGPNAESALAEGRLVEHLPDEGDNRPVVARSRIAERPPLHRKQQAIVAAVHTDSPQIRSPHPVGVLVGGLLRGVDDALAVRHENRVAVVEEARGHPVGR